MLRSAAARWANAVLAVVAIASMAANPPGDLDDIWFFAVEVLALLAIIGLAWTWRPDPAERSHEPVGAGAT